MKFTKVTQGNDELTMKRSFRYANYVGMCLVGVALNYVFSTLNGYLELPLYLDSIGTVLCAMIGGYIPGILVGFLTNAVLAIKDPSMIYYACVNALLAVTVTFLTRKGIFRNGFHAVR